MPTIFSHAIAASAVGQTHRSTVSGARFWIWTALCSMLPDFDVVGLRLGVGYGSMLGHRGLSHSLLAAVVVGALVAASFERPRRREYWRLAAYFALVTASHGVLDALTNGGRGVAFFAPFSARRYFFPWTPIEVSPIGVDFFGARGAEVLASEIGWIWMPALAVTVAARLARAGRPIQEGRPIQKERAASD